MAVRLVSADLFSISRERAARERPRRDASHPRFNLRAYGRFRFVGNREALTKRDGQVASTNERPPSSASAKSQPSPRPQADWRSNRNGGHLAIGGWLGPALLEPCSSSADSAVRSAGSSHRNSR